MSTVPPNGQLTLFQAPLRRLPGHSAKPSKSILKKSDTSTQPPEALFLASKKDKRKIKHARLMSRVTKSNSTKPRRRRPNNKLVTTLEDLATALPDEDEVGQKVGLTARDQVNIIKRKSMKSRPGALKRREKLDKGERDRFSMNMAQMATTNSQEDDTTKKWAALRGFISQTLEKRQDTKKTKT